jgi:hypothetical protein
MIRRRKRRYDDPILHPDHGRPRTRREFLSQGFLMGSGMALGASGMTLGNRSFALAPDLAALVDGCGIATQGRGKIPFICFDLAGGSNQAGSNVLVGQRGGQLDFLSTQGYERQGLPGDFIPPIVNPDTQTRDNIDQRLGLAFHADSAFLRGMVRRMSPSTMANTNGAVIPARSDNDTGNNPHNPMYGIARAGRGLNDDDQMVSGIGADGSLLTLIGSENSDSGGNSVAPVDLIDLTIRPTKVDRPSDVTGLVSVGDISGLGLSRLDAVAVMESIYRISEQKMNNINADHPPLITTDAVVQDMVKCGYLKTAYLAEEYGDISRVDPATDSDIIGPIFDSTEFNAGDRDAREYQKTASIMKMVINGFAGAGTIEMGGYDYHGGARAEGEVKDFRAGECMGACLEYAARRQMPLMLYVMSDGSLSSNGVIDNSADGRGKGEWTSDNSSTAATFFLVYNPNGRPNLIGGTPEQQALHQQIGFMRADGSVETSATPAANNVNLLVQTVLLNYMALHNEHMYFAEVFGSSPVAAAQDLYTAFEPIYNGTIASPMT